MSLIKDLLIHAVSVSVSDIHIKPNQVPFFRVSGNLSESGFESLSGESVERIVEDIIPAQLRERFASDHEVDFSHYEEGAGRFRVNCFMSQGFPSIAMRYVKSAIPTVEELRIPTQIKALAETRRGIVLLSGTTGSGKSTTLAAIIGEINRSQRCRIITVEDPVEYVFEDNQSVITQREIGLDTLSFQNSLKHVLRQDPDVILIGEMRDRTSIRTALLAAETGHLVMSTVHAGTADLAIPRILDMFPGDEQDQIRMGLAGNLYAIICQRLMEDIYGAPIPAVEIMFNTSTVRKLLQNNKIAVLAKAIETGRDDGMQTFNQSIYDLIQKGIITEDVGMLHATNPESLRMNLQGIFLDEGSRILDS
ncbi:MAG: PilT/PilU family type 4a pilus ATPase [Verrucomicrobia bacterium]|nr:PilT/PilU family type 4a pilus ATPase [Verrucomicrobiota bacterium]